MYLSILKAMYLLIFIALINIMYMIICYTQGQYRGEAIALD